MPPRIVTETGQGQPTGSALKRIPTWVWYGVGAVAGLVVIVLIRRGGSQSGTPVTPVDSGATSSLFPAPSPPSDIAIGNSAGSINLGQVSLTPAEVAQMIASLFPVASGSSTPPSTTPPPTTGGGTTKTGGGTTTHPNIPEFVHPLRGQGISQVGQRYGISLATLKKLNPGLERPGNPLGNWNLVYVTDWIRLW